MAKPSNRYRGRKAPSVLLRRGLTTMAVGSTLLALSIAFGAGQQAMGGLSTAVNRPAWWIIAIGALMIALHFGTRIVRQRRDAAPASARAIKARQPPPPPATIKALIDRAETDSLLANARAPADTRPSQPPNQATTPPLETPAFSLWSDEVFAVIEWRRFEAVCESLFQQAGFSARAQPLAVEAGLDLALYAANAVNPTLMARCQHRQGIPVGLGPLKQFRNLLDEKGLRRGIFATNTQYAPEALAFARSRSIHALDGAGLLNMIQKHAPEQQAALLAIAFEGEYWRPTCPNCGVKLMQRLTCKNGDAFWSCRNFPRCRTVVRTAAPPANARGLTPPPCASAAP
jgi:restriction system protein